MKMVFLFLGMEVLLLMSLMIGMYHTRELYNAEVKDIIEDRATDKWFEQNYY